MKPLKILALALFAAGTWWIAFTQEPEAPVQTAKPGHKSTELTRPIMTMYSSDKPDLHINSETGYLSSDGELVLLNGAVNIRREALKNIAPLEIDTHNLRIQLPNDFAETDEFVKIKSGTNAIEGMGLRAHFREPINIKILEQVRGRHEIN